MTNVENKAFTDATVDLDGKRFVRCRFVNCHLRYTGGECRMQGCHIAKGCVYQFDGAALNVALLLNDLGLTAIQFGSGSPSQA